jgi:hypothetical protein
MELNQGIIYHYDGVFAFLLERLYLIGPSHTSPRSR